MLGLFIFIAIMGGAILAQMWSGYVLSIIWVWLIIPTFPLMPVLSIPAAIGLCMIAAFLTHQIPAVKDNRDGAELAGQLFGYWFLVPLFSLGIAWVLKGFY
jgi:hypothetical protein